MSAWIRDAGCDSGKGMRKGGEERERDWRLWQGSNEAKAMVRTKVRTKVRTHRRAMVSVQGL